MSYDLTYGTDPEYFIVENIDGKEWGVPVPHFLENLGVPEIGYDESRKHPVLLKEDNFKVIMDGIAAEFTVPPVKNAKDFYNNISSGLESLTKLANSFGYGVSTKPTVYYDFNKYFNPESELLAWCGVFGCDPDRDAILENYTSPEVNVKTHIYRYGGGHFHISDNNVLIQEYPIPFIKLLAIFCGNFSIANSPYPDLEKLRMFKYGQPGRFRLQKYPDGNIGVEYRSPSNTWTTDLNIIEGMMEYAQKAYDYLNNPPVAIKTIQTFLDLTVEAIQEVDVDKANYILSKA